MEIIKDIEENVVKSEEAIKEIVEKIENMVEKKTKKDSKKEKKDEEKLPESVIKEAEEESLGTEKNKHSEKSIAEKKKELLEKAKKLSEKVEDVKTEELKEKVKIKKREDMLIQLEEYVKSGIYIGTRVVTPKMRQFVYRRRADGLAIFNTDLIDEKLREGIEYLSKFEAKDVIVVCKRQAGWKKAEKFSEITGIRAFTKKYPAGILTNTNLPDFFENELAIVTDSWLDKNALQDTLRVGKKVMMICDTNNFPTGAEQIIIGNNKNSRSLGVIFYLLARGFLKAKNMSIENLPELEWWMSEDERSEEAKKMSY